MQSPERKSVIITKVNKKNNEIKNKSTWLCECYCTLYTSCITFINKTKINFLSLPPNIIHEVSIHQ